MALRFVAPVVMAATLAGCGSIGAIGLPVFNRQSQPPVQPAAVPPVETAALPPPGGTQQTFGNPPQQNLPNQQAGLPPQQQVPPPGTDPQQALAPPPTSSPPPAAAGSIGRTDLLGGWTITSSGDSCQLFMTLTSWTGGYRASTRGCSNDALKSISAWDLKGNQVVLSGQGGTPVATLYSSGSGRFDGQTAGQGAGVSFYR